MLYINIYRTTLTQVLRYTPTIIMSSSITDLSPSSNNHTTSNTSSIHPPSSSQSHRSSRRHPTAAGIHTQAGQRWYKKGSKKTAATADATASPSSSSSTAATTTVHTAMKDNTVSSSPPASAAAQIHAVENNHTETTTNDATAGEAAPKRTRKPRKPREPREPRNKSSSSSSSAAAAVEPARDPNAPVHATLLSPLETSTTSTDSPVAPLTGTYVGAIDAGTSSVRFILFDHHGIAVGSSQEELKQIHSSTHAGWCEHDPMELMTKMRLCIDTTLKKYSVSSSQLVSIGITNQRETTVIWDCVTGTPLYNAIVWHDTRTQQLVHDTVKEVKDVNFFRKKTGLPISTYFSCLKIKWLLENVDNVKKAVQKHKYV